MSNRFVQQDHRDGKLDSNFTMVLGRVMAALNGVARRQGIGGEQAVTSPYECCFGQRYFTTQVGHSLEELRANNSPVARAL